MAAVERIGEFDTNLFHIETAQWVHYPPGSPAQSAMHSDCPSEDGIYKAIGPYVDISCLRDYRYHLLPGLSEIKPHADPYYGEEGYMFFHLPIIHPGRARYIFNGTEYRMRSGNIYLVDNTISHHIINGSRKDRITLVVGLQGTLKET